MKTVLITGVGRGIGKALAQKFLAEKYFVIGTSLTGDVDFASSDLLVHKMDLSIPDNIINCVEVIKNSGKKIDILINNSGALFDEDDTKVVVEKLRKTLEVNLIGTIDFTERLSETVSRGGHIINISSSAGSLGLAGHESHHEGYYPSYKISKAALNMYTRTLALRLKGAITVSSVHPGWVKTDMGGEEAQITPEEAAEAIFKLAISTPETGQFWFNGEKIIW